MMYRAMTTIRKNISMVTPSDNHALSNWYGMFSSSMTIAPSAASTTPRPKSRKTL